MKKINVFWDHSLPWGLVCVETLRRLGIAFRLLTARDIVQGAWNGSGVLLVPGGWASHKVRALGEAGKQRIREFIERGGSYLGFCGGAGLALSGHAALELTPLERMSLSERLPNASGTVFLRGVPGHPVWAGLPESLPVSIWWPSQFQWQPLPRCLCLAAYEAPGEDFQVADLPVADLQGHPVRWEEWEAAYGINLHPRRLLGQPAILEIESGRGRLILSYPHPETPGDHWGNKLFTNLLYYLDECALRRGVGHQPPEGGTGGGDGGGKSMSGPPGEKTLRELAAIRKQVDDLVAFGERHLLWTWRNGWLLRWVRGVRGLEYGTLAFAVGRLREGLREQVSRSATDDPWLEPIQAFKRDVVSFCTLSRELLLEEKLALQSGCLTKLGKVNATVDALREKLFGTKMNHGGLSRGLFEKLDHLLLEMLQR